MLIPLSVNKEIFPDNEIKAKAQFLELRKDNTLKIVFKTLAKFLRKIIIEKSF